MLASPKYFNVPGNKIGVVAASLVFWSLPCAIVGTFFVGFLFDILGRRLTLFLSFFLGGGLISAVPWTSPNVLPGLMTVRILIQLTFCAPISNPLSADYIHKEALGRGAALYGIGVVIGEVIAMGVFFNLTRDWSAEYSFGCVGLVAAVFAFAFIFMIKEPKLRDAKATV